MTEHTKGMDSQRFYPPELAESQIFKKQPSRIFFIILSKQQIPQSEKTIYPPLHQNDYPNPPNPQKTYHNNNQPVVLITNPGTHLFPKKLVYLQPERPHIYAFSSP